MKLADCWMDRTDNGHTDGWSDFRLWNHVSVDEWTSHVTDIQMDLSCTEGVTDGQIWGFT